MKLMYGNTPVKSLNINYFEVDTNSATVQPSDMQAGTTCFARGKKITGTGKSFEFASYGVVTTNVQRFVPTLINIVEISGIDYPVKSLIDLLEINEIDFSTEQTIGVVVVDSVEYPITVNITVNVEGYFLTFNCEKAVTLNFFCGKDNYI